jgi:hypothetical protein
VHEAYEVATTTALMGCTTVHELVRDHVVDNGRVQ